MDHLLKRLNEIGIALSAEKSSTKLVEMILHGAKELTNADGGTLYSVNKDNMLVFEIIATDSLGMAMGGTTGAAIKFPPIPLYQTDGEPLENMVVTSAVHQGKTINIEDAYDADGYDFSGTRQFDKQTGYRTQSLLTVPMKNHEDVTIGVLQLINSKDSDSDKVVAFSGTDQQLAESLASQAAVALTNQRLIHDLENLFEAFIKLIASAIDEKSPYTASHCSRIPELTMMLAQAVNATNDGPLMDFKMSAEDCHELRTAAWLHDCGKITSPEYVIDKSTKLETIFDRIELIDTRFEVIKRDAEIAYLKAISNAQTESEKKQLADSFADKIACIDEERDFLRRANIGSEYMSEEDQQRVIKIGQRQWVDPDKQVVKLLSPEECYNLTIKKGTLTSEERTIVNNHIVATIKMLESLPFPKHLSRVPEFAGGHHERMDGTGYPRGLMREEMSVPARMMAIADVFEALTARDRPYKKGKTLAECLQIMSNMTLQNHLDPDLFDVFINNEVYLQYAKIHMDESQLAGVDITNLPHNLSSKAENNSRSKVDIS